MWDWIAKITLRQQTLHRISWWLQMIPQSVLRLMIRFVGFAIYVVGIKQRRQIMKNMAEIYPTVSQKTIGKYCRIYFHTLVVTLYEILVESRQLSHTTESKFQCSGEEYIEEMLRLGRGAIIFSPHMGNFFYYYWYLSKKYNCLTVATGGSPILRPLYLQFQELGCQGLDYDNTHPIDLVRTLRTHLNNNGVVLLLGDFWRPNFPTATLFGRSTQSPSGAAALALDGRVPVIPFYGWHAGRLRHQMVFGKPLHLYDMFSRKQRNEAVEMLNRSLEEMIAKVPGQWFYWFNIHERWENSSATM